MLDLEAALKDRLASTAANHLWRTLNPRSPAAQLKFSHQDSSLLNFCSNDYLGLSQHPKVIAALSEAAQLYGVGSGSAQTISGHTEAHAELEHELAQHLQVPAVRLFSTGFMANLGIVATLITRHDTVFGDRSNHASLIDATAHSKARSCRFQHLNYEHLDKLLANTDRACHRRWIISDTVFSMSGSMANIPKLLQLACDYHAYLILDDAHGFGVLGQNGQGCITTTHRNQHHLAATTITFGKALGTFGACVAGNQTIIDSVTQYARSFLYTTAMPPALAAATLAALKCMQQEPERRKKLNENIDYFSTNATALSLPVKHSKTAIQCLEIGPAETATLLSKQLAARGLFVQAIRTPTVPKDQACLRITLTASHNKTMIDQLLEACHELMQTT